MRTQPTQRLEAHAPVSKRLPRRVRLARFRTVVILFVPHAALAHPPRWLTNAQLHPQPAAGVRDWLFNEDSLTRRLTALSNDGFSVTPLQEGWQRMRSDECAMLGVADGSQSWVREVYLRGHGQPWVFARSVALRSILEGAGLALDGLGNRPLGELLFGEHTAFQRGAFQVARYPADWLPAALRRENLWSRRSCFQRDALGVLVTEVFLPAFWERVRIDPGRL